MVQGFDAGLRVQQEWGWLLSIWLFLSGSAGGLFLLFQLFDLPLFFALLALAALLAGAVVLLFEQGSPTRAWRAVSRARTSWLSRGILFVTFFVVTSVLYVAPAAVPGLPWAEDTVAGRVLGWIAGLCALMVVLYPGMFLANNRSIPFWNTQWLPAVLVAYAGLGGTALVFLGSAYLGDGAVAFDTLAAVLIPVTGALLAAYLWAMHRAGGAAREAVRLLVRAPSGRTFQFGVVGFGLLLPLVLVPWLPSTAVLTGACMLVGSFLFRYCVLKAGVYVPPALVQEGLDFSRLNRTGSELEREYASMAAQHAGRRG